MMVISVVLALILVVAAQGDRVLRVLCGTREFALRQAWRISIARVGRGLLLVVIVAPVEALAVFVQHGERRGR